MDDSTVVVTGASRGIGREVAERAASAGAHVVLCARDAEDVGRVVDSIEADGGTATGVRADVRDEYDVERFVERAARIDGGIDAVVANAGVYHGDPGETPIHEESYAAFDDHMRTNVRGVFATIREAAPHLDSDARAVVLSGAVARRSMPGYGSYAVSKAGAEAVARGFSADLDTAVGVVDPGKVETDLTGAGGRDPEDAADMVRWALTEVSADDLDGAVLDWRDYRQGV